MWKNCWKTSASKAYRERDATSKTHGKSTNKNKTSDEFTMVVATNAIVASVGRATWDKLCFAFGAIHHLSSSIEAFHIFEPRMRWVHLDSSEYVLSIGTEVVRVSGRILGAFHKVMIRNVIFASDMIRTHNSKCRIRQAWFRIVAEDNRKNPNMGITRIFQKDFRKTSAIFQENRKGLDEPHLEMNTSQAPHIVHLNLWHRHLCHVSKYVINESYNSVSRLSDMSGLNEDVLCKCCKVAKCTQQSPKALRQSKAFSAMDRV